VIGCCGSFRRLPFASALLLAAVRLAPVAQSGSGAGRGVDRTLGADRDSGSGGLLDRTSIRQAYTQVLWTWIDVAGFEPQIAFYLDALSLVMILVVTFVGFLIHIYSAEFMIEDEGFSRFFGYMNLFVASMITLLLANNLLLLYLGWEGVGLCSYLLIGFWYREPANGARRARRSS
jgi:NADH-quinone oxidoreductase subunit L